jgi:hypothetical protein
VQIHSRKISQNLQKIKKRKKEPAQKIVRAFFEKTGN